MCAAISFQSGRPFCFTSDPDPQSDGIIYDTVNDTPWPTEHIFIPPVHPDDPRDIDKLILDAVAAKESKGGAAYAAGKTLIVFSGGGSKGKWSPARVAQKLPPGHFRNVWAIFLQTVSDDGEYTYGVTCLRSSLDPRIVGAFIWLVRIDKTFESWKVERRQ
jgi:hypothetical protein